MKDDVINILATHQNHKELGLIAQEALEFIKGKTFKIWQRVGWVERSDTHHVDHFNKQDMTRAAVDGFRYCSTHPTR